MVAEPQPHDASVPDDAVLLRRITPLHLLDPATQTYSSAAFHDPPINGSMSVFVRQRLIDLGASDADVMIGYDDHGLVAIPARVARDCGFEVLWVPGSDGRITDGAHAEVVCKKTGSRRHRLQRGSDLLIWPGSI